MQKLFVCGLAALVVAVVAPSALAANYVVLYKQQAVPADASSAVQKAGGTVVQTWPQIGVAIARSDSASFSSNITKDSRVDGASSTADFGVQLKDNAGSDAQGPPPGDLPDPRGAQDALDYLLGP